MKPSSTDVRPLILIAEDDPDSVFYFTMVLRRNYDIESVDSVNAALKAMRKKKPDLILLDLSLEGKKDGLDLVRQMRKTPEWKAIPVIAATAHAFERDRLNCMQAGCNGYLPKPIKMKHLIETVQSFLPS
ncbi:MAG: response regulator [FCB group bacterium]|nr:response regulator [FCB group bacterium]